jgi:cobalt transporter subunit CbtB
LNIFSVVRPQSCGCAPFFYKEFFMHTSTTAITTTTELPRTSSAVHSLLLQLAAGAALGMVVFYGVAFSESPLTHNAAHDVRHITVKPCH